MKKMRKILLLVVVMIGLAASAAMAQPKAPSGLVVSSSSCTFIFMNKTNWPWELAIDNVPVGSISGSSEFREEIKCPSQTFEVTIKRPGYDGITITRTFNPSEKTGDNKFIWQLGQ